MGSRVALFMPQGSDAVVATLGALRAGAIYVPLDTRDLDVRLARFLDHVEARAILTDAGHRLRLERLAGGPAVIDVAEAVTSPRSELPIVSAGSSACIYPTSGSTGRPKGVLDSHRNVLHNVMRYVNALRIQPADRLSLLQPPAFSGTVSSLFSALLTGAALFPYRLDLESLDGLSEWVARERLTMLHAVPAILRRALADTEHLPDVRVVRLEGDRSYNQDMALWRRVFSDTTILANGLGMTEAGLCRQLLIDTSAELPDGIMPVGYPVTDMEVTVRDEAGHVLPAGHVGQIHVTSAFLAQGYWGDPASTAAAFQDVPGRAGLRDYASGDLGRMQPDGCLEYLGRVDGQAKVGGQRVEPGEIEAAMASIPGLKAVAVRTVVDRRGEARLAAWVVPDHPMDSRSIQEAAATRLPMHLRPSHIVQIDALPLGPHGKVDRRALILPDGKPEDLAVGLLDEVEALVANAVREVLERPVPRDADLFLAGVDSLAAADIVTALERASGRPVPTSLILRAPTIASLADALRTAGGETADRHSPTHLSRMPASDELLLVHAHHGHALIYARLARELETRLSVLAIELGPEGARPGHPWSLEALAAHHVAALRTARPRGPYRLGGYCFGGILAIEMARRLRDEGDEVTGLYVMGVTPYDLPGIVLPESEARWHAATSPRERLRTSVHAGRRITTVEGRAHVATRLRSGLARLRGTRTGSGPGARARLQVSQALNDAFASYRPASLSGHVTLILSEWSVRTYAADAAVAWAGLADRVDTHVVRGSDRLMLRAPIVAEVAEIIAADAGVEKVDRLRR